MIPLSTTYALMNGSDICVMKASKARCWSELRRRRAAGDVHAWIQNAPGLKVGQTDRYTNNLVAGE